MGDGFISCHLTMLNFKVYPTILRNNRASYSPALLRYFGQCDATLKFLISHSSTTAEDIQKGANGAMLAGLNIHNGSKDKSIRTHTKPQHETDQNRPSVLHKGLSNC